MPYRVRGMENRQMWIVYATNRVTAELIAGLFRKEGYEGVEIQEMPDV